MNEPTRTGPLSNLVIGGLETKKILVVDDEETIRLALSKFLRSRGYIVDTADAAPAAIEYLQAGHYSLMLCDIRMPGMSGLELVPLARKADPTLAVIMLTALNDAPTATESLSAGAMEYLTKPVDLQHLLDAIERVSHRRDLAVEQRNVERLIASEVELRTGELERQATAALRSAVDSIAALVVLHEINDPFLAGTSTRVTAVARAIAEELGVDETMVEHIATAARLYDVGKLAVRDAVLHKPGALSPEEIEHVRDHVRVSLEILTPLFETREVLEFIGDHHEHWNGGGYPRGLMGERISLGGRVLCMADTFIALTSRRAYRPAMSVEETVEYLAAHAGSLLDPRVYAALRTVVTEKRVLGLTAD